MMRTAIADNWHQLLKDPSGCRMANRKKGLGKTMVIDKGLGPHAFSDFVKVAGSYIDIVKLAFGTAVLYDPEQLRNKLTLASSRGIIAIPGGTLLEAAVQQGTVGSFMDTICSFGFTGIEISDGTIHMNRMQRTSLIKESVKRGLAVMTEYGKKTAGSQIDPEELAFTALCDWEAGAELVTIEARESGLNVGLFDAFGRCKAGVIEEVIGKVSDVSKLMWEAPLKSQQAELLLQFGAHIHLGNVAPDDALALEAMRRGLRSDTFQLGQRADYSDYMI